VPPDAPALTAVQKKHVSAFSTSSRMRSTASAPRRSALVFGLLTIDGIHAEG